MSRLDRFITIDKLRANPLGAEEFTPFRREKEYVSVDENIIADSLLSMQIDKALADGFTANSQLFLNTGKGFSEEITISDSAVFDMSKALAEAVTVSSSASFWLEKPLEDQAVVLDLLALAFGRALAEADIVLSPDELYLLAAKVVNDTVLVQDSGLLEMDDYFVDDYIDDGYAGTERTF